MPKKGAHTVAGRAGPGRVFVDTSAWIALFSSRDQNHVEAENSFRALLSIEASLITSNLVLAEMHRLVLHRVGVQAATLVLDKIESSRQVTVAFPSNNHHAAARKWLSKMQNVRLTYADAVSFALMEDSACNYFLSFDSHFSLAGFRTWTAA